MNAPNEAAEGAKTDDVPVVDTDVQTTETPLAKPTDDKPIIPETPVEPTDVELYQDVVSEYNKDPSFQMSDEQAEAFLSVKEKVNNGDIEEPPLKSSEPEKKEDVKPAEDVKPETETNEKPESKVTNTVADNMTEAMKKVGAKDVTELPGKIQELLNKMGESGGKLGTANKGLQERVESLEADQLGFNQLFDDLKSGKPEAVEYFTKTLGIDPAKITVKSQDTGIDVDSLDPDDFVDEKQFNLTKQLLISQKASEKTISDLKKVIDKGNEKNIETEKANLDKDARVSYVDNVVDLITKDEGGKIYGLSLQEAKGLAEEYFKPLKKGEDVVINPKFQKIHELILFAWERKYPDLATAHVMQQHEGGNYAEQIIAAHEQGSRASNHAPSKNTALSEQQSRGGNEIPDAHITEDTINKIERGAFELMPDEWSDPETGALVIKNIPERFHAKLFPGGVPKI